MSTGTSIEWTDASWNPLRARRRDTGKAGWHCERVSDGCANCYAATFNRRRLPSGGTGLDYARDKREQVETQLDEHVLTQPLRWSKRRKVFVCSMTDLFGEWVTDEQIDRVFAVMAAAHWHDFQLLTKRPARMRSYVRKLNNRAERTRIAAHVFNIGKSGPQIAAMLVDGIELDGIPARPHWPIPQVWLGVSVESQETADERIPLLLDTPAAVRFVSAEPLLGPVDFRALRMPDWMANKGLVCASGRMTQHRIDWFIVGGESGPRARACDIAWIFSIVEQCKAASVACFVKQLGARPTDARLVEVISGKPFSPRLRDRKGGDPREWPADLRVRKFPQLGAV